MAIVNMHHKFELYHECNTYNLYVQMTRHTILMIAWTLDWRYDLY